MVALTRSPGVLAPGQRIYAIGDVHGQAGKLAAMHAQVAADLAARPVAEPTLIHMGDYIDRGPDSAGVLARLLAGPPAPGMAAVNLMGNHEAMLLDALADPDAVAHWMGNGGKSTLKSWGIEPGTPSREWAIPPAQLGLLRGLALGHRAGGYLFVHAGVRPLTPLEHQDSFDLLWMREPFLSWPGDFGAIVVHGHTPTRDPVVRDNRIGIDTGAGHGRRLTCLILEDDRLGFLDS